MDSPLRPPTDNLYKFVTVFGLVGTIVGSTLHFQLNQQYATTLLDVFSKQQKIESTAWESQNSYLNQDVDYYEGLISKPALDRGHALKTDPRYPGSRLQQFDQSSDLLKRSTDKTQAILHEAEVALLKNIAIAQAILPPVTIVSLVISAIGFYFWWHRHQKYQDELLRTKLMVSKQELLAIGLANNSRNKVISPPIELTKNPIADQPPTL